VGKRGDCPSLPHIKRRSEQEKEKKEKKKKGEGN
jgi:hypothetical protein